MPRLYLSVDLGHLAPELRPTLAAFEDIGYCEPHPHLSVRITDYVTNREELYRVAEEVTEGFTPLHLQLQGMGVFPDPDLPRYTVYAKVTGELDRLFALHAALDERILALGYNEELYPYTPHVTLGMTREVIPVLEIPELTFTVDSVVSMANRQANGLYKIQRRFAMR